MASTLGQRLHDIRIWERGLLTPTVANAVGITPERLWQIEHDEVVPTESEVRALAWWYLKPAEPLLRLLENAEATRLTWRDLTEDYDQLRAMGDLGGPELA